MSDLEVFSRSIVWAGVQAMILLGWFMSWHGGFPGRWVAWLVPASILWVAAAEPMTYETCPCCGESWTCLEDCTFEVDCPTEYADMQEWRRLRAAVYLVQRLGLRVGTHWGQPAVMAAEGTVVSRNPRDVYDMRRYEELSR